MKTITKKSEIDELMNLTTLTNKGHSRLKKCIFVLNTDFIEKPCKLLFFVNKNWSSTRFFNFQNNIFLLQTYNNIRSYDHIKQIILHTYLLHGIDLCDHLNRH